MSLIPITEEGHEKIKNNSAGAWALQIALLIALMSISAIVLASFKTGPARVTAPGVPLILPDAPTKASHPATAGLTFAERVTYQRAIEDVYWRHRIWPK